MPYLYPWPGSLAGCESFFTVKVFSHCPGVEVRSLRIARVPGLQQVGGISSSKLVASV